METENCICGRPEDVKDYRYKELRKIDFGDTGVSGRDERFFLLCTSNHFGLTFVGCKTGVYVFKTAVLYEVDKNEHDGGRNVMVPASSLGLAHIPTPAPPIDIGLSCDSLTLSVCLKEQGCLKVYFYNTSALSNKSKPVSPFSSIVISTDKETKLNCLQWNPVASEILIIVLSTGIVGLLCVSNSVSTVCVSRKDLSASSACWSPKGKQVALGLKTGLVVQCETQKLDVKKQFQPPDVFEGERVQVCDLYWLTTFEYAVVYTMLDQNKPMSWFLFMNTKQKDKPLFINSEDVFYVDKKIRTHKFYFACIRGWATLMACSTNSIDIAYFARDNGPHGVVGNVSRDHSDGYHGDWWEWDLDEHGRVAPPLDSHDSETYSVGVALDFTSEEVVQISETTILPSSPLLLLFTDHGVLCPYTVINTGCPPDKIRELMCSTNPLPNPLPNHPIQQPTLTSTPSGVQSTKPVATPNPNSLASVNATLNTPTAFSVMSDPNKHTTPLPAPGSSPFRYPTSLTAQTSSSVSSQPVPPALYLGMTPRASFPGASVPQQQQEVSLGPLGAQFGQGLKQPGQGTSFPGSSTSTLVGHGQPRSQTVQVVPLSALNSPLAGGGTTLGGLLGRQSTGGVSSVNSSTPVSVDRPLAVPLHYSTPLAPPIPGQPSAQTRASPFMFSVGPTQPFSTVSGLSPNVKPSFSSSPAHGQPLPSTPHPGIGLKLQQTPATSAGQSATVKSTAAPTQRQSDTPQHVLQTPRGAPTQSSASLHAAQPEPVHTHPTPAQQVKGQTPSQAVPTIPISAHHAPSRHQDDAESLDSSHMAHHQDQVEAEFATDIRVAIDSFADEMDILQEEVNTTTICGSVKEGIKDLGSDEDRLELFRYMQIIREGMNQVSKTFEKHDNLTDQIKNQTFKGFEMYEEARSLNEKKRDPRYSSLLKIRPLDSCSSRLLNDVRATFLQVSRALDEVNAHLDMQLEKKYEERRQRGKNLLKAPSIQTVYSTLRDQHRIIRLQSASIYDIIQDMKKLTVLPKSWQPDRVSPTPPRETDSRDNHLLSTVRESVKSSKESVRGNSSLNKSISRDKVDKLRESLSNIERTPVKTIPKAQSPFNHPLPRRVSVSTNASEDKSGSNSGTEAPDGEPTDGGGALPVNRMRSGLPPCQQVTLGPPVTAEHIPQLNQSNVRLVSQISHPSQSTVTQPHFTDLSSASQISLPSTQPHFNDLGSDSQISLASKSTVTQQNFTDLGPASLSASQSSLSSQGSHLPHVLASASGDVSLLKKKSYMTADVEPPQTLSGQSFLPSVIASPQGDMSVQDENGYTGCGATHSKADSPQRPTHMTPGTIHWSNPNTDVSQNLPPKDNTSLGKFLTGIQTPPTSSQHCPGVGELRRTAPHGDLSQIKPSRESVSDATSSMLNTSLSVPNIAASKHDMTRTGSVQTLTPFNANSTPQVPFGVSSKTESASLPITTENSAVFSSGNVSQIQPTTTVQVSSLSNSDTKQATSASFLSKAQLPNLESLLSASGIPHFSSNKPLSTQTSTAPLLPSSNTPFTFQTVFGTNSFSIGLFNTSTSLASTKPVLNSVQSKTDPTPTVTPKPGTTPIVFGDKTCFTVGSRQLSMPVSVSGVLSVSQPPATVLPTTGPSGVLSATGPSGVLPTTGPSGVLSTKLLITGDQTLTEVSIKNGTDRFVSIPSVPVSSSPSVSSGVGTHSDSQPREEQPGGNTSENVSPITKALQPEPEDQTETFDGKQNVAVPEATASGSNVATEVSQEQQGGEQHYFTEAEVVGDNICKHTPKPSSVEPTTLSGKPPHPISIKDELAQEPPPQPSHTPSPVSVPSATLTALLTAPVSTSPSSSDTNCTPTVSNTQVEFASTNIGSVIVKGDIGSGDGGSNGTGSIGGANAGSIERSDVDSDVNTNIGDSCVSGTNVVDGGSDVDASNRGKGIGGESAESVGGTKISVGIVEPGEGVVEPGEGVMSNEDVLQEGVQDDLDDGDTMGDTENDMEPDDCPNKPFPLAGPLQSSSFNIGFDGLGGKPSGVTANPFGTPSTQPGLATPQAGLFRPSAFGQQSLQGQQSPLLMGGGGGGGLGRGTVLQVPTGQSAFGGAPSFGSGGMFGSSPSTIPDLSGRIFGSGGGGGGGGGGGMFNSPGGDNLSFGNLAQSTPSSGFGGGVAGNSGESGNTGGFSGSNFSGWRT